MRLDTASMARSQRSCGDLTKSSEQLVPAAMHVPEVQAVVERVQPHGQIAGLWILRTVRNHPHNLVLGRVRVEPVRRKAFEDQIESLSTIRSSHRGR